MHKQNPEKSNASSSSSGRSRDREKMWAAMEEDVEMYLKLKTSFLPFCLPFRVRENEFTIFGAWLLGMKSKKKDECALKILNTY